MRARLRTAWQSRAPRERIVIAAMVALLLAALYVWIVFSAQQARGPLRISVATLRADAVRLDQQALEYAHLRATPSAASSSTPLPALVQATVNDAGLSGALTRIDATDANQVVVVFGAVAFADWLDWTARLATQHVRLDACRIEALSTPGLVSVTATLVRARPQ